MTEQAKNEGSEEDLRRFRERGMKRPEWRMNNERCCCCRCPWFEEGDIWGRCDVGLAAVSAITCSETDENSWHSENSTKICVVRRYYNDRGKVSTNRTTHHASHRDE